MLDGDQPFQLKLMGNGGEQRKAVPLDTHEIVIRLAAGQVDDHDPYAQGSALVSDAGVEVVIQLNGAGMSHQVFGCRLRDYTINRDGQDGDFLSLKRWTLVSRGTDGKETILFEAT